MSRPQENREIDITRARPKKGAAPAPQGSRPLMGRENTRDSRTRKSSTAQRAHRLRGPAARKRMPVRGDKQEPGLPERAANGQAGAEPVSRRSPYCWYLRPWQAARTCMWTA